MKGTKPEVIEIRVTFSLPEWFASERHDYRQPIRYAKGHAWEGQIDRWVEGNRAVDALLNIKGVDSVSHHPWSKYVEVLIPETQDFNAAVREWQEKLRRFLGRYKEAREDG